MHITPSLIYLWQLADTLQTAFTISAGASASAALFYAVVARSHSGQYNILKQRLQRMQEAKYEVDRDIDFVAQTEQSVNLHQEHGKANRAKAKRVFLLFLVFALLRIATPSSNTVAMMVVIPKIAQSQVIQQDVPDLYNAAVSALKSKIIQP
jgi:hypothetical protein